MTFEIILEQIRREPFRPFALETTGGSWVEVDASHRIAISDTGHIAVFSQSGALLLLEADQVSALEVHQ